MLIIHVKGSLLSAHPQRMNPDDCADIIAFIYSIRFTSMLLRGMF